MPQGTNYKLRILEEMMKHEKIVIILDLYQQKSRKYIQEYILNVLKQRLKYIILECNIY